MVGIKHIFLLEKLMLSSIIFGFSLLSHIFAVAEVAFFELVKDRRNQVMVVR